MNIAWTRRETIASAGIAVIAALFLFEGLKSRDANPPAALLDIGIAFTGAAFALSPHALFERVTIRELKLRGPVIFGFAALCSLLGTGLLLISAIAWIAAGVP
jgi:hypothetical protein